MVRHALGVFSDADAAYAAVQALNAEGVASADVSVLRWHEPERESEGAITESTELAGAGTVPMHTEEELLEYSVEEQDQAIRTGFWSGGALGALAGLVAGTAAILAGPVGLVAILGPLATALGGAAMGATVGSFAGSLAPLGVSPAEGQAILNRMKNGALVVAVSAPADQAPARVERLRALGADPALLG